MKFIVLAAAFSLATPGLCLAQTSAPSSNPSAHSVPSSSAHGPVGSGMTEQGKAKPCSMKTSGTSDRGGGSEKTTTASGGASTNPNGKVSGGNC